MDNETCVDGAHSKGEHEIAVCPASVEPVKPLTFGGIIHVEFDPEAPVTPLGQFVFFSEFLHTGGLFDRWVRECPLEQTSPNAHAKRDILGTYLLSVLSGHTRYSHIGTLKADRVCPGVLKMNKAVSVDSARRAFVAADQQACGNWMSSHLHHSYGPLLYEDWVLDIDTRVKTLYGHQEGATVGYNPHKPGRPSHTYHTYFLSSLRLILDVDVQPGNQSASSYTMPGLWAFLDALDPTAWPSLIRGDCGFGNEKVMVGCEKRGAHYLFKLRLTRNVRKLIERMFVRKDWVEAGKGWEAVAARLQLSGWTRERQVVVLRRKVKDPVVVLKAQAQQELVFGDEVDGDVYEYAVLVTDLEYEPLTVAQLYRDRADSENVLDELVNQWGWCGFTTQDLARSGLMARIIALIYNWWSLYVRLAFPFIHKEAVTSRPLFLSAIARQTRSSNQTTLHITSTHSESSKIAQALTMIHKVLARVRATAEQFGQPQCWQLILSIIFAPMLGGRPLRSPFLQLDST